MKRQSPLLVQLANQLAPIVRRQKSPRMVIALIVALGAYLLAAPILNRSLGWDLPGWRDLAGSGASTPAPAPPSQIPDVPPVAAGRAELPAPAADPQVVEILDGAIQAVYESPAGLSYGRGSEHGHRLRHVMAHTRDEPERPGSHGVFLINDPQELIGLVDEAYQQALRHQRTQTRREESRTIYTVDLGRTIGYVGGEGGNRAGRPQARKVRLVLEGRRVITAFPIR